MLMSPMVESNRDEERLARIEHMVEALQRESDALKVVTARLVELSLPSDSLSIHLRRPILIADRRRNQRS